MRKSIRSRIAVLAAVIAGSFGAGSNTLAYDQEFQPTNFFAQEQTASNVVVDVALGETHTCALVNDGSVWCWGSNSVGEAGFEASDEQILYPAKVDLIGEVVDIEAGSLHTCALIDDGSVWCWGENSNGQLGNGTFSNSDGPTRVDTEVRFTTISAGGSSCGIDTSSEVWCWGHVSSEEGWDYSSKPQKVQDLSGVTKLSVGGSHVCAVNDENGLFCWGANNQGQLGNGSRDGDGAPIPVPIQSNVAQVSAGGDYTCVVLMDKRAGCWGVNSSFQLGNGNRKPVVSLTVNKLLGPSQVVSAGNLGSCSLKVTKRLWCWGKNESGQAGIGRTSPALIARPSQVITKIKFQAVERGNYHTCAISLTGKLFCWGNNYYGSVGDGTTVNRSIPTAVVFSVN